MDSRNAATAVGRVLDQQGRSMAWLSRKANVSESYAWRMIRGERTLTPEFRKAAVEALGVPEDILFPTETAEQAS